MIIVILGLAFSFVLSSKLISLPKMFMPIYLIYMFVFNNIMIWQSDFYKGIENKWDYNDFVDQSRSGYGSLYGTNYPPLAVLFYKFFHRLVSVDNDDIYVINYAVFLYMSFCIIGLIVSVYLLLRKDERLTEKHALLVAISFLMTSAVLFSIQRLNTVFIAMIGVILYCLFCDSENTGYRFIALFCLALSANIKYYPAVFGVVLLKEKRWRDAFVSAGMGVLLFVLPVVLELRYRINNRGDLATEEISDLGEGMSSFISERAGTGISLTTLAAKAAERLDIPSDRTFVISVIAIGAFVLLSLVGCFVTKKKYAAYILLGLMCVFVPPVSYWYSTLFLIPGAVELIRKDTPDDVFDHLSLVLLSFVLIYAYQNTFVFHVNSTWHLLLLWLIILADVVRTVVKQRTDMLN